MTVYEHVTVVNCVCAVECSQVEDGSSFLDGAPAAAAHGAFRDRSRSTARVSAAGGETGGGSFRRATVTKQGKGEAAGSSGRLRSTVGSTLRTHSPLSTAAWRVHSCVSSRALFPRMALHRTFACHSVVHSAH
jgi:hypothetical protein